MSDLKKNKNMGAVLGKSGAFLALAVLVILLGSVGPCFRTGSKLMSLQRRATVKGRIA